MAVTILYGPSGKKRPPPGLKRRKRSVQERFEEKFTRVDDEDSCWPWNAHTNPAGYGDFHLDGKTVLASHVSYELYVGPRNGRQVLHTCDNPPCVRPKHLFLGNPTINNADKVAKGRQMKGSAYTGAKLTEEKVLMVKADLTEGKKSLTGIGREHGISRAAVIKIRNGELWAHVVLK